MKKLHLLALFALLAAVSVAFTSCDIGDEPSMIEETDHKLTEWVESYADFKGGPADAKAYMSTKQPRYELAMETNDNGITVLIYTAKDQNSVGITYTFRNGELQDVISSEFAVNLDLVVKGLEKKYIRTAVSPEDSEVLKCLYKFTNEQGNLEIKLYESSKEVFGLIYTRK